MAHHLNLTQEGYSLAPWYKREELVVDFIDSYIDSFKGICKPEILTPLNLVHNRICTEASEAVRYHISGGNTEQFIKQRNYLWKIREIEKDYFVVEKQPLELREILGRVLASLQTKCARELSGIPVKAICTELGPKMWHELEKNVEKVKEFLLGYPSLFMLDPFDHTGTLLFNKSLIIGKVILPPGYHLFNNPVYLQGEGTISWFLPDMDCGLMYHVGIPLYFRAKSVTGCGASKIVAGQKFLFEAVQGYDYENGVVSSTKSFINRSPDKRWCVFWMAPVGMCCNSVASQGVTSNQADAQVKGMSAGNTSSVSANKSAPATAGKQAEKSLPTSHQPSVTDDQSTLTAKSEDKIDTTDQKRSSPMPDPQKSADQKPAKMKADQDQESADAQAAPDCQTLTKSQRRRRKKMAKESGESDTPGIPLKEDTAKINVLEQSATGNPPIKACKPENEIETRENLGSASPIRDQQKSEDQKPAKIGQELSLPDQDKISIACQTDMNRKELLISLLLDPDLLRFAKAYINLLDS